MARIAAFTNHLDILGVRVSLLESYQHAVEMIVERIGLRDKMFCVAINPEKIYRAQSDTELRELLNGADLQLCDGVGAALAMRLLHGQKLARITGIQLFFELIAAAEQRGRSVFFLGASEQASAGATEQLRQKHPHLNIVGRQNGYFSSDAEVVEQINRSGADMLFVAMGSPRQERWIVQHQEHIRVPFRMGIGGTLDVVSGKAKWAPPMFRRTGTEFFYRLIREPRRWRRQLCLPLFLWCVLRHAFLGTPPGKGDIGMEPVPTHPVGPTSSERRRAA